MLLLTSEKGIVLSHWRVQLVIQRDVLPGFREKATKLRSEDVLLN